MAAKPRVLLIGLSGSSSSGKTTLCALLSAVMPPFLNKHKTRVIFLHCDAYGKDFNELPRHSSGFLNAEGRYSLHFDRLIAGLDRIKRTGDLPTPEEGYASHDFIEFDLRKAREKLQPDFVEEMSRVVQSPGIKWSSYDVVCFVDGFLLYHDSAVRSKLDFGIFLRASKAAARVRRFGRYDEGATPEGSEEFWKTKRYFEELVWPTYVDEHSFLFPGGDVEAVLTYDQSSELERQYGLWMAPKVDMEFKESMRCSVRVIFSELEKATEP